MNMALGIIIIYQIWDWPLAPLCGSKVVVVVVVASGRRVEEKRAFHVPDGAAHSFLAKVYAFRACTPAGKKKCLFRNVSELGFFLADAARFLYIFIKREKRRRRSGGAVVRCPPSPPEGALAIGCPPSPLLACRDLAPSTHDSVDAEKCWWKHVVLFFLSPFIIYTHTHFVSFYSDQNVQSCRISKKSKKASGRVFDLN